MKEVIVARTIIKEKNSLMIPSPKCVFSLNCMCSQKEQRNKIKNINNNKGIDCKKNGDYRKKMIIRNTR